MIPRWPRLIVFSGPPCSGKTTLAAQLHAETRLPHLAIDNILRRVLPGSSFEEADRDLAYRVLQLIVEYLLAETRGVIVDGTFARATHLEDLEAVARGCEARLFLIECKVEVDVAVGRFRDRAGQHPAVDLDEGRVALLNRTYPYRNKGLVLDASRRIDECLAEIRHYVGSADN
jgi:predicted kinase